MTSRDFCYWLQGYFEITKSNPHNNQMIQLTKEQVEAIQNHLKMVFKADIDPSFQPILQTPLDDLHSLGKIDPSGLAVRC